MAMGKHDIACRGPLALGRLGHGHLSRQAVPDGECRSLATFGLVDHFGIPASIFLPQYIAARRHAMRLVSLRRIATNSPVQFSGIDFYMRPTLLSRAIDLSRQLYSKIAGRGHYRLPALR